MCNILCATKEEATTAQLLSPLAEANQMERRTEVVRRIKGEGRAKQRRRGKEDSTYYMFW